MVGGARDVTDTAGAAKDDSFDAPTNTEASAEAEGSKKDAAPQASDDPPGARNPEDTVPSNEASEPQEESGEIAAYAAAEDVVNEVLNSEQAMEFDIEEGDETKVTIWQGLRKG